MKPKFLTCMNYVLSLRKLCFCAVMSMLLSCNFTATTSDFYDSGVSKTLAEHRASEISDLKYKLFFNIPKEKAEPINAWVAVEFHLNEAQEVVLDFRESEEKIARVMSLPDQKEVEWRYENEHIIIPKQFTAKGRNEFHIDFTAGDQSLNRRDDYLYTLFVPDRARTCFPCFDQPDMKARFNLTLEIPAEWTAVSNSQLVVESLSSAENRKTLTTNGEGDILPTYLFAFAVGKFEYQEHKTADRTIGAYYRETDPQRLAQLPEIFRQVEYSLKWNEEFTGHPYGFQKYDLVILPGFQFGGMEHTGCTFYNDNTLFLGKTPTQDELLSRAKLIAHETTHMWFGDLVTMKWFDDVWTKEVFANYFAHAICRPLFPDVDHELNWLKTFKTPAVAQDRTEGRTAIQQPLDNMRNAGLIYNNIIYNKAPLVMRRIVEMMGEEPFRRGIQKYVARYAYGNATWDDLIQILDAETSADIQAYSDQWVKHKNYPTITATTFRPNAGGREYGYFEMTEAQIDSLLSYWHTEQNGTARQSLLMTLQDNFLNGRLSAHRFLQFLVVEIGRETTNPLMASTLVGYTSTPLWILNSTEREQMEQELWTLANTHPLSATRLQLMRNLSGNATSAAVVSALYDVWSEAKHPLLSVNDYMTLAYELALRYPERSAEILKTQKERIKNADRLAQFEFVSRAVVADEVALDSVFASLLTHEGRRIEPWAGSVMHYLNHPLRQNRAVKYIRPALDALQEVQRTGDIFFPQRWCNMLLDGHSSAEARAEVEQFYNDNPQYPQLLKNKILASSYSLFNTDLR